MDQELFLRDQNSVIKEEIDLREMAPTEGREEVVDPMVTEEEADLMSTEEVADLTAIEEVAEAVTEVIEEAAEVAMKEGEAQEVDQNHLLIDYQRTKYRRKKYWIMSF